MENDTDIHLHVTNTKLVQIPSHKKTKQNLTKQVNGIVYDPLENWAFFQAWDKWDVVYFQD